MIFFLPVSIYTYTYGYSILTKRPISLKKLTNPILVSMIVGMIAGLVLPYINLPAEGSALRIPVSVISSVVTALRLLIIPIAIRGALWLVGIRGSVLTNVLLYTAMPCGMNTVVFPRLIGEKCDIGASLALLSNLFACVTIPVVLALFGVA